MSRALRTVFFTVAMLPLAACATHESFSVPVLRPAPVDLGRHELVAMDHFGGGPAGSDFSAELSAALEVVHNPLTGQVGFELVDRNDVDQMLDDMRRYPNADLDSDPASPLAKWRRADVMITGVVDLHDFADEIVEHGVQLADNTYQSQWVRTGIATVRVTIETVENGTDRVLDRAELQEVVSATTKSANGAPEVIDPIPLLGVARERVIQRFVRRVTPHEAHVSVRLYFDEQLPELEMGNGYARTGDWDAALEHYQQASERASNSARYKARFNEGVALLYTNQFDEAREAMQEAFALERDGYFLQQIRTVDQRAREFELLQEQSGRAATPSPQQ